MQLYDYARSSAAYRVRIALNWKGLDYASQPVDLLAGAQHQAEYAAVNPQRLVPTLVDDGGFSVSQSLAICEYLEERYPVPALLPADATQRATVRSLALLVACDIHPIANLRVRQYLENRLQASEEAVADWIRHWIDTGFAAYEARLDAASVYSGGDAVSIADVALVPQHYNAERFGVDLTPFPRLNAIVARCNELPAFAAAHPSRQADAG